MYSNIISGAINGIGALLVNVEVDISSGLPGFSMVGCLSNEVRESKDRVWAALKNNNLSLPLAKITINISPADIRKDGTIYDLPIIMGILCSSELIKADTLKNFLIVGELGLDGEIKPVKGILPIVLEAKKHNITDVIVPFDNAKEGAIVPDIKVRGAKNIKQLIDYFSSENQSEKDIILPVQQPTTYEYMDCQYEKDIDFNQVNGQDGAKKAALIAAAGFHSMLMSGPPGSGKSMIAKRIPTIMPPLSINESLEVSAIYSIAGALPTDSPLITRRPFRAPHHTISRPALLGGGAKPKPGEVSLSHKSVLFLDELTEFDSQTIDCLRQPLEEHVINISRSKYSVTYPADFLLISALNPCPCGYYPDRNKCHCSEQTISRYLGKISGPILDRIDLCVELKSLDIKDMKTNKSKMSSEYMRSKVSTAREIQKERFKDSKINYNSEITSALINEYCNLEGPELEFMEDIYRKLKLSARSYHRILRVSRTIADINESKKITREHLLEATLYRPDNLLKI